MHEIAKVEWGQILNLPQLVSVGSVPLWNCLKRMNDFIKEGCGHGAVEADFYAGGMGFLSHKKTKYNSPHLYKTTTGTMKEKGT